MFNLSGQTGKGCLPAWADGVKSRRSSGIEPATFHFESAALTTAPEDLTQPKKTEITPWVKAGPPLDLSFWSFLTFLHHGIEEVERHLL